MKLIIMVLMSTALLIQQSQCDNKSSANKIKDKEETGQNDSDKSIDQYDKVQEFEIETIIDTVKNFNPDTMQNPPDPTMIKIDMSFFTRQIDSLTRLIEQDEKNASLYAERGNLKDSIGDHDGACEDWKKSKRLGNKSYDSYLKEKCP